MRTPAAEEVAAAALASLPGAGAARLRAVLSAWPDPVEAWDAVVTGRVHRAAAVAAVLGRNAGDVGVAWRSWASSLSLEALAARLVAGVVRVSVPGAGDWPEVLDCDPEPPAVLFARGDLAVASGAPAVAIVGTRRCTSYGRDVARQLGRELAAAGVRVVSGLAAGIDGAAHEGALAARAAPPVGVVGSGVDVVYPRRHASLWRSVAEAGVLLGEAPLGAAPEPWRFPARNRIIAALAHVVVVVESHPTGGSRHTVEAALERDRTVMAVPGSLRSPASRGTNTLLAEGCAPVLDTTDVLVALGLAVPAPSSAPSRPDVRTRPSGHAVVVLDALGWAPASTESLVQATRLAPAEVAVALVRLERDGWVVWREGHWEQVPER